MSDEATETKPERVLIVEDNEHAAYLLRTLLERAGYSVVVSPDGRDALAKLASMEPVDLVMLDLMLPYVSGYQVLIEARQNPKWQRVPIVVVTARTLEIDAVRALETGANDFIRKPFSPEELVARVRRAIELNGAPVSGARQRASP
jgi:DNA-binding response OmpR family regulator